MTQNGGPDRSQTTPVRRPEMQIFVMRWANVCAIQHLLEHLSGSSVVVVRFSLSLTTVSLRKWLKCKSDRRPQYQSGYTDIGIAGV